MIEYLFIAAHFWREILLGVALAAIVTTGVKWKHAIQHEQQLKDQQAALAIQLHAFDSTVTALHKQLADQGAEFVPESVYVTRWAVRHDTLEQWRHDTITVAGVPSFPVPVQTVAQNDSAKAVCHDLLDTCSAFKRTASRIMAIQDSTIHDLKTHPLVIQTSCKAHDAVSLLVGAGLGAGATWAVRR